MNFIVRALSGTALLAAAVGAQAQSSVQLYGLVDVGVGRFEDNGADVSGSYFNQDWRRRWRVESGLMSNSFWGLKGQEALVNGVSLEFKLESFFLGDTGAQGRFAGDPFFGGDVYLGLTSKNIGSVHMGRNTTPLFESTRRFNAFGDSYAWSPSIRQYFNGNAGGQLRGDSRWNNSMNFVSAEYNGFTLNAMVAAGEGAPIGAPSGTGKNLGLSGVYVSEPLAATAAWQSVKQTNASDRAQTTWQLGGRWDLKLGTLFGQVGEIDDGDISGIRATMWAVSAAVPLAGGNVLASYGESRFRGTGSGKRSTVALGYSLALSKRTDVTATVIGEEVDAGRAINFSGTVSGSTTPASVWPGIDAIGNVGHSYGINIRHRF